MFINILTLFGHVTGFMVDPKTLLIAQFLQLLHYDHFIVIYEKCAT